MNNTEYNNTVAALLGDTTLPASAFPPPATQSGFTNDADQTVGSLLAEALATAAQALAAAAVAHPAQLLPCDPAGVGEDACAERFIAAFGARAFRRPLLAEEQAGLRGVYQACRADGASFASALETVVSAVLTAPSFLYITELGAGGSAGAAVALTPFEVASALSYFVLASPPDAQLEAAAAGNRLGTPAELEVEARRLLADPRAGAQIQRFFSEWFEIHPSTKDVAAYPEFAGVSPSFLAETPALVADVMIHGDATFASLLTASYTFVDGPLAQFYGLPPVADGGPQRVSLDGTHRRGLLSHASFLSVHGDAAMSSPVKRGAFVRRRLLCQDLPPPPPGVKITPPLPTPSKTTRQLFDAHMSSPSCSPCHSLIDPIGNGFEDFDGEGRFRTTDNGAAVDAHGEVTGAGDADGTFEGAAALGPRLAGSATVQRCLARNLFRFGAAQSGDPFEQELLDELPAEVPASVRDLVVAYARTKMFGQRLAP
jgi:hypothetical protein